MPTNLTTLLRQRANQDSFGDRSELGLETGRIFVYAPGNVRTNFCNGFCWKAPGTGCAVIEVWGAGGSSARMCCCGWVMPGNAGAYSRKCITVTSSCYVCGVIGFSCSNADALCCRGCSEATQLCWFGSGTNGCICSQGGRGGCSICFTDGGCGGYCCYRAAGFCSDNANLGTGLGRVCNYGPTACYIACGYGGDVNCCGQFSCITFMCINGFTAGRCCILMHTPGPANVITCGAGSIITHNFGSDMTEAPTPGQGLQGFFVSLSGASRSPTKGSHYAYNWRSDRTCSCYESTGCTPYVPYGFGGPGDGMCDNVRSNGYRGGSGAVRIRFYT